MTGNPAYALFNGMERRDSPESANRHAMAMGRRLRVARKALGLTGDQLAELVGGGVNKQKISRYETAADRPSHLFLARLEKNVGITASWIVSGNRASLPGHIIAKIPPNYMD